MTTFSLYLHLTVNKAKFINIIITLAYVFLANFGGVETQMLFLKWE